jgi:uncharacterized membrane protein YkoI
MTYRNLILSSMILCSISALTWADDDTEEHDLARYAIAQSGMTTVKALELVESTVDGIIYEYELEEKRDHLVHEFDVVDLKNERKIKVTVDVASGALKTREEGYDFGWFFTDDEDVTAAQALESADFSIKEALALLTLGSDHLVLDIDLEESQGIRYFEIETAGPEGEREWLVDLTSKQLIPTLSRPTE